MQRKIFITMDQDWACDEVMTDTQSLFNELRIPVTLFVTNPSPILQDLRTDPLFRLGIHPNLTPQLNGQSQVPYQRVLEEMKTLVPEAEDIRCHAIVDATPILVTAKQMGFKRDLNLFIPFSSGIPLKPFTHFGGIRRLPYFYEDDAYCFEPRPASPEEHLLGTDGLKIFNFHPIHLFLNTETMERYNRAKAYYHDYAGLKPFVNPNPETGARSFLRRLAEAAEKQGYSFESLEVL